MPMLRQVAQRGALIASEGKATISEVEVGRRTARERKGVRQCSQGVTRPTGGVEALTVRYRLPPALRFRPKGYRAAPQTLAPQRVDHLVLPTPAPALEQGFAVLLGNAKPKF